jgi:hypothetical protein
VRYELRRVPFDPAGRQFGEPETLVSVEETGKSILMPRASPGGRYLVCCFCDYGCFPIYQPSSDLYLVDLSDGSYRRLDINSEQSESYHSWSSNGRWLVFSSKRGTGVFTRSYLAYFGADGTMHRPFVLPQQDPAFYESFLKTFTVPEFSQAPVRVSARRLGAAARTQRRISVSLPETTMSPAQRPGGGQDVSDIPWRRAEPRSRE